MQAVTNNLDQIDYIFKQLPYGILIENQERKIHSVNLALLEIFEINLKPEDLKGFDCEHLAMEVGNNFKDRTNFLEIITDCIKEKTRKGPFPFLLNNGKYIELSYIPYHNSEKEFIGHSWCYANITKQKVIEQQLQNQTSFFKNILHSIPADIVLFNTKHEYQFINKVAIKDDSLREWMIGKKDEDYCSYRNKPLSIAKERRVNFDRAIQTKSQLQSEDCIVTEGGKEKTVLRILQPFLNAKKEVEFVVGYGLDVTDFKTKTLELIAQETKSNILKTQIKSIVFSTNNDLKINDLNPAWGKITGLKPVTCLHMNLLDYVEEKDIKEKINLFSVNKNKTELNIKFRLKIAENSLRWVEGFIFKEVSIHEKNISFWGVFNDIEKQVRTQENLVSAINKEKELNELKSNFVNMVSHEVRTPLAGILSSVELLEIINSKIQIDLKEKNSRHFGRIKDQILRIGDLMNNVLILGKIEAGSIAAKLEEIDLVKKIDDFLNKNFSSNNEYDCTFKYYGKKKIIKLDWKLITHVLTNLISNALKYSVGKPKPEIHLTFKETTLSILIKDYGIGILPQDLTNLFIPFNRGSNVNGINGTGLGLVLVKYFVELHSAEIKIDSEPDKGTEVTLIFPY